MPYRTNKRIGIQAFVLGVVHFLATTTAVFLHFALSFSADRYSRSWIVSILSAPVGLILDPTDVLLAGTSQMFGLAIFAANSALFGALYFVIRASGTNMRRDAS